MTRSLFLSLGLIAYAVKPDARLIEVGDGVKLEVLDWGGTGRPVILLAGSGNTAHIYEDFAPKLADCCHVYAITRRGYGVSIKPARGYSVPELSEDVWRVIQSLQLSKPVVIGHSMAGSELSFLGQKHSSDLGGIIYLDANADPMDFPWSNVEFRTLTLKTMKGSPGPPQRTADDNASVDAYRAYQRKTGAVPFPAAEIRNMYEINPDGFVGKNRTPRFVSQEIDGGSIRKDYADIEVPVLALIAVPLSPPDKWKQGPPKDQQARAESLRSDEILMEFIHRWEGNLKRSVPKASVIEMPGAHHHMFLDEEESVLRNIHEFMTTLK